jgi:hypothetical protein
MDFPCDTTSADRVDVFPECRKRVRVRERAFIPQSRGVSSKDGLPARRVFQRTGGTAHAPGSMTTQWDHPASHLCRRTPLLVTQSQLSAGGVDVSPLALAHGDVHASLCQQFDELTQPIP